MTALLFFNSDSETGDLIDAVSNGADSHNEVTPFVDQISQEISTMGIDLSVDEFWGTD